MTCSPLVFYVDKPKFQNVFAFTLLSQGHESSTTQNKICSVISIQISHSYYSPFCGT